MPISRGMRPAPAGTLAEVKAQLAQQDQLESIRTGLLREKAVSHAMSRATIAGA